MLIPMSLAFADTGVVPDVCLVSQLAEKTAQLEEMRCVAFRCHLPTYLPS
jgi:hypothetical protein